MAPVSSIDPFATEFLRNPWPWHHELREAGPVVRLERYGVWAMARYDLAAANRDPRHWDDPDQFDIRRKTGRPPRCGWPATPSPG